MKIIIKYDSSWQAGMLDGNHDEKSYNTTRKNLKSVDDFSGPKISENILPIEKNVSISTVHGLLYRLTGDVRPLWMIKKYDPYLDNFVSSVKFEIVDEVIADQAMALRDISNADNPGSWSGPVKTETCKWFTEPELREQLFYPLSCSPSQLYDLIVNGVYGRDPNLRFNNRLGILEYVNHIKNKGFTCPVKRQTAMEYLKENFEQKTGKTKPEYDKNLTADGKFADGYDAFVASALYLTHKYLCDKYKIAESNGVWSCAKFGVVETNENKWSKGISARGYGGNLVTQKDVIKILANRNSVMNYPMDVSKKDRKNKVKTSGGTLIINLELSREQERHLKEMIEDAHVGTFRVGKKGLAYVDQII